MGCTGSKSTTAAAAGKADAKSNATLLEGAAAGQEKTAAILAPVVEVEVKAGEAASIVDAKAEEATTAALANVEEGTTTAASKAEEATAIVAAEGEEAVAVAEAKAEETVAPEEAAPPVDKSIVEESAEVQVRPAATNPEPTGIWGFLRCCVNETATGQA
mmetsp:Transcript_31864/g.66709  ORF Transcript_31864/g.66709 Transcript_31864/m.66709 type:complete len:160 (+) Transcript_31864:1-480(+)